MKTVLTWLMVAGLATTLLVAQSRSAADLYQEALHLEEVKGDLQKAVAAYQTIVERFRADRSIAAKAQLRLGICYEKLGKPEARTAYETVLHDYADQAEVAAQARARLAALTQPQTLAKAEGPTLQELKLEIYNAGFALSPDGTKVAYQHEKGNLRVRDLRSGEEREFGRGWIPVWSPDGKRIAFSRHENYWNYEILIVSVDTGEEQHREVNGQPADWSRDGRFILYRDPFGSPPTLNLLPVGGGLRRRVEIDWNGFVPGAYRFSPDGRYITYSSRTSGNADIYLLAIDGGEPVRLTEDPARDYDPVWTADGRLLLFLSSRVAGRTDLWGVRILAGKPVGDPFVVRADVGDVRLYSLSDNGRLLYARERAENSIYVTAVDPATYAPVGQAVKLGNRPLPNFPQPAWSPDGKRVAYIDATGDMPVLRVMAADGTDDREIAAGPFNTGPFGWCSEEHIYVQGRSPAGRAIHRLSVSTTEQKIALLDQEILGHVACAPDGTRLAFLRGLRKPQVYTADIDGQNLRQVTFADQNTTVAYPAWSPDGKELAFSFTRADKGGVMVLSLDDGSVREAISSTDPEHRFYGSSWSPDARRIAWFARVGTPALSTSSGDSLSFEIRTSAASGDHSYQVFPVNLGGSVRTLTLQPQWSPDGKKMLFTAGHYLYQIFLMDNFLPDAGTKAQANGQGPSR